MAHGSPARQRVATWGCGWRGGLAPKQAHFCNSELGFGEMIGPGVAGRGFWGPAQGGTEAVRQNWGFLGLSGQKGTQGLGHEIYTAHKAIQQWVKSLIYFQRGVCLAGGRKTQEVRVVWVCYEPRTPEKFGSWGSQAVNASPNNWPAAEHLE